MGNAMNDLAAALAPDAGVTAEPPVWKLSALYAGREDARLDRDLTQALEEAKAFRAEFEGRLAAVEPARFGEAIVRYEALFERLNKAMSFAQLYFAADMADPSRGRFKVENGGNILAHLNPWHKHFRIWTYVTAIAILMLSVIVFNIISAFSIF